MNRGSGVEAGGGGRERERETGDVGKMLILPYSARSV